MAIKVVVFDYDLTLYNITPEYYNVWDDYTNKMLPAIFGQVSQVEFQNLVEAFEIKPPHTVEKVARACLYQFGTAEPLLNYMFNNPYEQDYKNMRYVGSNTMCEFANNATLYIVSNAPSNNIERQLNTIAGIDSKLFKGIFTNEHKPCCPDKSYILKQILKIENINPQEMLVVGDSFFSDILPAQKIGAKTYQINEKNNLEKLLILLKQQKKESSNEPKIWSS